MSFALILAISSTAILPLPLLAFLSFGWLLNFQKSSKTEKNTPILGSYANQITFFRFIWTSIIALFLHHLPNLALFFLFGFPIFLDGIDGFIARKYQQESSLGALLDKTTDAYFVLVLSFILMQNYEVPFWFLGIGYLHYGYELLMQFLGWSKVEIPKNPIGKYIAALLFISLLCPFILPIPMYLPIIYLTALLTSLSFGLSFWFKFRASVLR